VPPEGSLRQRIIDLVIRDSKRVWRAGAIHISASDWIVQSSAVVQRIILARILGAANIGHIAVVSASFELLTLPANLGINTPINKLTAERSGDEHSQLAVLTTGFTFTLFVSVAVAAAAFILLRTTGIIADEIARGLLNVIVMFLPLAVLWRLMISWLAGRQQMQLIAKIQGTMPLLGIVTAVTLSYYFQVQGWLVSSIAMIIIGFSITYSRMRTRIPLAVNTALLRRMLRIGLFAFLGQAVGTILLRFDTLCVSGIMKNPEATGIYNTAALAYQQLITIVGGILYTVFPYVAKNRNNMPLLRQRYWELTLKLFGLSAAGGIVAWFAAPLFFPILGHEFAASVIPFRILVVGSLFRAQYVLVNTYLDALGRTDVTFATGLLAMVSNIVLNLLFIPRWGIAGAAWATVISLFFSMVVREAAFHYLIFHKKSIR
jgi:O-antigen/teichoic acid export membrane protein